MHALQEVIGCLAEYRAMPTKSLLDRLFAAIDTAEASAAPPADTETSPRCPMLGHPDSLPAECPSCGRALHTGCGFYDGEAFAAAPATPVAVVPREALEQSPPRAEFPGVDPDLIAECLHDYAQLLRDGAVDGAGRYFPADIEAAADRIEAGAQPAQQAAPITARYTNWRGETRERTFMPQRVYFGSNEWHPEPQVLIDAVDCETGEARTFAAAGFAARPAPVADGWVLVPREPTAAMRQAAIEACSTFIGNVGAADIYRAMLAAAPTTEAGR